MLFPRNPEIATEWAAAAIAKQGGTLCTAFGRCGRCALTITACEEGNEQRAGTTEHLHKGNPGQWKPGFSLRHHERFQELGLNRLGASGFEIVSGGDVRMALPACLALL